MRTKKTYIIPKTEHVILKVNDKVMQDVLQDTFSGGDPDGSGIVIGGSDDDEGSNQINHWSNHLWDE